MAKLGKNLKWHLLDSAHKVFEKSSFFQNFWFQDVLLGILITWMVSDPLKTVLKGQNYLGKLGIRTHDPNWAEIHFIKSQFSNSFFYPKTRNAVIKICSDGLIGTSGSMGNWSFDRETSRKALKWIWNFINLIKSWQVIKNAH